MSNEVENEFKQRDFELVKLEHELSTQRLRLEEKKIELGVQLSQFGLRGTLTGAIGGLFMVIILAILGAFLPDLGIDGTHITIIIGIICVTVGMYGAFVFNRSASFAARIGEHEFKAGTADPGKRA